MLAALKARGGNEPRHVTLLWVMWLAVVKVVHSLAGCLKAHVPCMISIWPLGGTIDLFSINVCILCKDARWNEYCEIKQIHTLYTVCSLWHSHNTNRLEGLQSIIFRYSPSLKPKSTFDYLGKWALIPLSTPFLLYSNIIFSIIHKLDSKVNSFDRQRKTMKETTIRTKIRVNWKKKQKLN